MSEDMLGKGALAAVAGPLKDLAEKLAGPDGEGWFAALKRFLRKEEAWAIPAFSRDMRKKGWEPVENIDEEPVPASGLELVSFLKRGESSVSGETMCERAKKAGANLAQRQAEYLLDHQGEIPSEWRNFYLVFPGTVWRAPDGRLGVPYLRWYGVRWDLSFSGLECDWRSGDRLVRLSK